MKTNQKQLKLIQYGLRPSTVTDLSESQVNSLFIRLTESKSDKCGCGCDKKTCTCGPDCKKCDCGRKKKETKEDTNEKVMVSGKNTAEVEKLKQAGATFEVYEEMSEEDLGTVSMGSAKSGYTTQLPKQVAAGDGTDDERQGSELDESNLMEKFESKKQQKYFFAKCGDGKTKEQKKWCKMAEEFADKTNFKKLPEKKKQETKESMNNLTNKIAAAYAGGLNSKLKNTNINPTFGENEIEKHILRLVEKHITPKMSKKDFLNLVNESPSTAPSRPDVMPGVDTPTKPSKPDTPYRPKPNVKPAPKAGKESPVRPDVMPGVDTPTKPSKPDTPYRPKPNVKPAPKARKKMPKWLSFDELGIKLR